MIVFLYWHYKKKTPNKQDYINTEYNLPITIGKICSENNVQILLIFLHWVPVQKQIVFKK